MIFVIVLIITAVRIKSMDSHRISGRILAENIAGPGMLRLVEQSMQARARKTSVTEIAVKERKHPQAALTFDDGPDIRYTPLLLDGLKERNVRVSFFLLGEKVEQYPELVERMQKEGHLVGNHTYHHVQLNKLNETKAREEILKTNNLMRQRVFIHCTCARRLVPGRKIWNYVWRCFQYSGRLIHWTGRCRIQKKSFVQCRNR